MTTLAVYPGRNVWLWARTDRDAPSADDVIRSAGAMMVRTLPLGVPVLPPASPDAPTKAASRYYVGPARPMDITPTQADVRSTLPAAFTARWTWEAQPEPMAVRAERTWYALVDFDWRGSTVTLDRWPRRAIDVFGFEVDRPQALDWLLIDARHVSAEPARPDSSLTQQITNAATDLGTKGLSVVVLLALAYLLGGKRK